MRFEKPPQEGNAEDEPPQNGIPEIETSDIDRNESEVFDRKTSRNYSVQHDSQGGIDLHTEGKSYLNAWILMGFINADGKSGGNKVTPNKWRILAFMCFCWANLMIEDLDPSGNMAYILGPKLGLSDGVEEEQFYV